MTNKKTKVKTSLLPLPPGPALSAKEEATLKNFSEMETRRRNRKKSWSLGERRAYDLELDEILVGEIYRKGAHPFADGFAFWSAMVGSSERSNYERHRRHGEFLAHFPQAMATDLSEPMAQLILKAGLADEAVLRCLARLREHESDGTGKPFGLAAWIAKQKPASVPAPEKEPPAESERELEPMPEPVAEREADAAAQEDAGAGVRGMSAGNRESGTMPAGETASAIVAIAGTRNVAAPPLMEQSIGRSVDRISPAESTEASWLGKQVVEVPSQETDADLPATAEAQAEIRGEIEASPGEYAPLVEASADSGDGMIANMAFFAAQ